MTIEMEFCCKYKKEYVKECVEYKDIMSGFIHNKSVGSFDFDYFMNREYNELMASGLYEDVRIREIRINAWDLLSHK